MPELISRRLEFDCSVWGTKLKKIIGMAAVALLCTSTVALAKPKDKGPKPTPAPAPAPSNNGSAVSLVTGQCFAVNTTDGCKFNGIINSQADADTLEGLYNALHADIDLNRLGKLDQGAGLDAFLSNIIIKDSDPNEIIGATFTRSGWLIDHYALKAGTNAVLFAVGTPGDSFSFNMSALGNKGVSHIVLFGREGSVPNVVPEPATWAMMLGGFGLIGGALRRRKLNVVFA